jgi:hypothetical protein
MTEFAPPREVVCTVFTTGSGGYEESHILMGNMVYITTANSSSGAQFYYGVKFYEEDQKKLEKAISRLQQLADRGEVQQV